MNTNYKKKKLKFAIFSFLIILTLVFATACGGAADTVDPDAEVEFLVVLITDRNGIEDAGINASCWQGLQRAAEDFHINVEYVESKKGYSDSIAEATKLEPDLIICPSPDIANVLSVVADQYTDDLFVIFDAELPEVFNATTVYFNPEQSAYLAGTIAALSTEEKIVGFMGAEVSELSNKYLYGFTAGVVNSDKYVYISTNYIETSTDARKAKETAVAQCKLGADVIFHIVGNAGTGVVDAADERGFKVISLIDQQANISPEATLCTIAKNGDAVAYDIAKKLVEGSFDGTAMNYSLAEDAFYIDDKTGAIPEEILEKVNNEIELIKTGKLIVPYDNFTYQTFINGGEALPIDETGIINTNPEMDVE